MKLYRQGDVLIIQVTDIPQQRTKYKESVLAYGEVTGHAHRFTKEQDVNVYTIHDQTIQWNGRSITIDKYFEITEPKVLTHEEHNTHEIEPGKYITVIEREYDYIEEEMKQVVD